MISKKLLTIIAGLTVLVSGTAGFAVVTGAIYIGPSVPGFNITGNGTTDVGVPVYLGVTLDSTPASSPYYLWFANGKTGTGEYFSVSFSSPGTYKISLQVSMDNNHTKKTEYATEVVNRDPSVSISENKNTIDAGQYISFTSSVSGGTGPYSYSWTSPGSSNADPTMQLYSDIGGVYVTITDAVGYSVNSNILNPTINTDPYVIAVSNMSYTDVGSPVSLSASPYYGTSPYSYSWTWNGNVISTSQNFSYSFDQSGQQFVYVTLTDKLGMTSSDYVSIEVEKDPTVSISASSQSAPTGTDVSFLANVNNGLSPFSYQWYIDGVSEGGGVALYYTFNNVGTYSVEVVLTDAAGQTVTATVTETIT